MELVPRILLLLLLLGTTAEAVVCGDGNFELSAHCFKCKDNCKKCSYFNDCSKCMNGFYASNNECLACSNNCEQCTSSDDCTVCNQGFFIEYRECTACMNGCLTCTSEDKCDACMKAYYLTSSSTCEKCLDNCLECNPATLQHECTKCEAKYFGESNGEVCSKCSIECKSCSDNSTCNLCLSYYYFEAGNCFLCGNNCQQCSNTSFCSLCSEGYYIETTVVDGVTIKSCAKCSIDNCKTCSWENSLPVCLECKSQYYTNGYMCLRCSTNCETCSAGKCIKCLDKYFLDNSTSTCVSCVESCKICIAGDDCLSCDEGFFLYTPSSTGNKNDTSISLKTCKDCIAGCSKCSSATDCTSCMDGFYMKDNECLKCPAGCLTCLNETYCDSCEEYFYFMKTEGNCEKCLEGCYSCLTSETCEKCTSMSGYDANYNSGYDCEKCSNGCDSCDSFVCSVNCSFGMMIFLQSGYKCISECINGCEECIDGSRCITCARGYYLDSEKQCQVCINNCEMCTNETNCYQCKKQYFPKLYSSCDPCIENCYFCDGASTCLICMPQYYLAKTICQKCQYGCLKCLDSYACSECASYLEGLALYLDSNSKSCVECPPGCYNCSNAISCEKCKVGYIMSAGGSCMKCLANCIHCTDLSSCRICEDGYFLTNSLCSKCVDNCIQCSDASNCLKCKEPYIINTINLCEQTCNSSCTSCISFGICTSCIDGYYLKNNLCEQCPDYSVSCSYDGYNTIITRCATGYYVNYNKCSKIPSQNCEKYDLPTKTCLVCTSGYHYTSDGLCEPACSPHCLKCSVPYSCSQCQSGYVIANQNECKLVCSDNCEVCLNSTYCDQCSSGYTAELGICTACNQAICLNNCTEVTNEGCSICDATYYVYVNNNECKECNLKKLSRSGIVFKYSLCTGLLVDTDANKIIGTAYTGSWFLGTNYTYDICSMANPMYGVIPIGKYKIKNIICRFMNESGSRVLELEAVERFSEARFYDSFFANLYIYSDTEVKDSDYTYTKGYNGITANSSMRDELTIGDTITVTYDNCDTDISECETYPPPTTGTVLIQQSASRINEFLINFKNWGGVEKMDTTKFIYKACVRISPFECIEVCEEDATASTNGILCNSNNTKYLGSQFKGGSFPIKYKVRYRGSNNGIYSNLEGNVTILEQFSNINSLSDIKTINNVADLFDEVNSKRNILYGLDGVNYTREKYYGNYLDCPTNYCFNGGSCKVVMGLLKCTCKKEYTGELCLLTKSGLSEITEYFNTISEQFIKFSDLLEISINNVFEVLNTLSIVPEATSHVLFTRIIDLATNYSNLWDFEIVERLEDIIPNLMASIKYRAIVYADKTDKNTTEGGELLKDVIYIENLIKFLTNYKSSERAFHYLQELGLNGIYGYLFKESIEMFENNATLPNTTLLGATISYPYAFSQLFSLKGYTLASDMLSVFAYEEGEFSELSTDYNTLQFMVQDSNNGLISKKYEIKCACYDTYKEKLSLALCKAAEFSQNNVTCDCSYSSMCFVVYREKSNLALFGLISLVVIVVPFLIAYRKKLVCSCRGKKKPANKAELISKEGSMHDKLFQHKVKGEEKEGDE